MQLLTQLKKTVLKGYNKARIQTFCRLLSDNVKLLDNYLPNDFTIVISKQ